jgi:hypothetical protein
VGGVRGLELELGSECETVTEKDHDYQREKPGLPHYQAAGISNTSNQSGLRICTISIVSKYSPNGPV